MELKNQPTPKSAEQAPVKTSPVRAVISWLVETDREFRAAQSMVNDTYFRP